MKTTIFFLMLSFSALAQVTPDNFPDPFDSLEVILDRRGGGQIIFKPTALTFTVTDQIGDYLVNLRSNRSSDPKAVEFKAQWSARKDTAKIAAGAPVNKLWKIETKQARILIPTASTTGTPSVEIKNTNGTVYAKGTFKQTSGYWYVYLNTNLTQARLVNIYGIKPGSVFEVGNLGAGQSYLYNFATSSFTVGKIFK